MSPQLAAAATKEEGVSIAEVGLVTLHVCATEQLSVPCMGKLSLVTRGCGVQKLHFGAAHCFNLGHLTGAVRLRGGLYCGITPQF